LADGWSSPSLGQGYPPVFVMYAWRFAVVPYGNTQRKISDVAVEGPRHGVLTAQIGAPHSGWPARPLRVPFALMGCLPNQKVQAGLDPLDYMNRSLASLAAGVCRAGAAFWRWAHSWRRVIRNMPTLCALPAFLPV
jgi:hypothetical protein